MTEAFQILAAAYIALFGGGLLTLNLAAVRESRKARGL